MHTRLFSMYAKAGHTTVLHVPYKTPKMYVQIPTAQDRSQYAAYKQPHKQNFICKYDTFSTADVLLPLLPNPTQLQLGGWDGIRDTNAKWVASRHRPPSKSARPPTRPMPRPLPCPAVRRLTGEGGAVDYWTNPQGCQLHIILFCVRLYCLKIYFNLKTHF